MEPNALSTDVQQALQHAIGQLNDAFEQSTRKHNKKDKKSSKKHARPEPDSENDGREVPTKKKKISSKGARSRSTSYAVRSETQSEVVAQEEEEEVEEEVNTVWRSKSNDKKKSKGKQKAIAPSTTSQSETSDAAIDPLLTGAAANPNTNDTADPNNSAAFISAILAAASATADPQQQQQPEQSTSSAVPAAEPTQFPLSDAQFPQYFDHPPPAGFPGALPGAPFPDPSMFLAPGHGHALDPASLQTFNEDLVRALQELDVAKLSAMLKGLGDAAAQLQGLNAFPSVLTDGGAGQVPVSSSAILGHRPKNTSTRDVAANKPESKQPQRSTAVTMPVPFHPADVNLSHAHILATRWMSAGKLAQMVRDEGLVYKKGKFSSAEEGAIKQAIDHYQLVSIRFYLAIV